MNREQRRAAAKRAKKDGTANAELEEKIGLFESLGDECLVCEKPFDKKDKSMVMTWSVVTREAEGVVNLYCPTCWGRAQTVLAQARNMVQSHEE